jgi:hypothetical protein
LPMRIRLNIRTSLAAETTDGKPKDLEESVGNRLELTARISWNSQGSHMTPT